MPSVLANVPSDWATSSRRRIEYSLRLSPTGASAWSYNCETRRAARRRWKQVQWERLSMRCLHEVAAFWVHMHLVATGVLEEDRLRATWLRRV